MRTSHMLLGFTVPILFVISLYWGHRAEVTGDADFLLLQNLTIALAIGNMVAGFIMLKNDA